MDPLKPVPSADLAGKSAPDSAGYDSTGSSSPPIAQATLRLDRLTLKNIFGLANASFEFDPNFNLIVGINGSGKTSLLQAIAGAIAPPINGVVGASDGYWIMEDPRTFRTTLHDHQGRIRLEKTFPARIDAAGAVSNRMRTWSLIREKQSSSVSNRALDLVSAFESQDQDAEDVLPVAAFYSSHRRWKNTAEVTPESSIESADSRASGYEGWNNASADLTSLQKWVTAKSLERLEATTHQSGLQFSDAIHRDELSIVNRAVARALPDSTGIRFDMRFRKMVVDWANHPDPTPFEDLSDGQRGVSALVADIARRMCLLNPQAGADVTSKTPGIVVIDELDMHLHPAWQRRIVNVLRETFPLVQFFAATHSPQIIGEVPASHILLLRRDGRSSHPERSYGLDSSEVLEEIMGSTSRNSEVAQKLSVIQRLLDDEQLPQAQRLLDELKQSVGSIPEVTQLQNETESLRMLGDHEE